jgi:hypothetical protein
MIGLLESYPALPIAAAMMVFVVGFVALFAFATVYFDLYRCANGLANRMAQPERNQSFLEPDPSLPFWGSADADPRSSSIIPTIGKALVLDTTERMPTS